MGGLVSVDDRLPARVYQGDGVWAIRVEEADAVGGVVRVDGVEERLVELWRADRWAYVQVGHPGSPYRAAVDVDLAAGVVTTA